MFVKCASSAISVSYGEEFPFLRPQGLEPLPASTLRLFPKLPMQPTDPSWTPCSAVVISTCHFPSDPHCNTTTMPCLTSSEPYDSLQIVPSSMAPLGCASCRNYSLISSGSCITILRVSLVPFLSIEFLS